MKAITVECKKPGTAKLMDIPEPDEHEGSVLVEAIAVGVCGTDVEIEWDMCRNGLYTERGIKEIHGFMSERL